VSDDVVWVVRGESVIEISGRELGARAAAGGRVVVDLGRPIAVVAIEGILSGVLPPADVVEIVAVDVIHDDDGEVLDDEPVDGLRTQIRKGDHLGR